jgi:hypothetical protein
VFKSNGLFILKITVGEYELLVLSCSKWVVELGEQRSGRAMCFMTRPKKSLQSSNFVILQSSNFF